MAEEKLPDAEKIIINGIFTSTVTTPDGPSLIYADINDIFDFVEYDRRKIPTLTQQKSDSTINAIKKTLYEKGYLFDIGESYNSSIAFPVAMGANGRIQIGEGNHRLRAVYEVAQETGQTIYVPIYAFPSNVSVAGDKFFGGEYRGSSRFVGEQTLFDALRQLMFDSGADDYAVNEKIGERLGSTSQYTGSNYLGSGGTGGNSVSQEDMKKFFTAIGVEVLTYDELPEDNVYKTGVNNLSDTPTGKAVLEKKSTIKPVVTNIMGYPETPENLDTPTNVVDDVITLNTDLVWREDLGEDVISPGGNTDQPRWKKGVVKKNNILKPNLNSDDLKKIIPQILDGTVSDIDFTRFGIWLMHHSPTPAYGAKPFSSSDMLADVTKIVIFNGKSPIDLVNKDTLEQMKFWLISDIGAFTTDITTGPNAGSKSSVGLSDELILQFGKEEGPFANAQQRMKQTIINEHNKLYANADDYFILFRGGALTDDPVQSFSKDGFQAWSVGLQTNQKTITQGRGIDAYFVNKNDFIDLHSLGLDARGEVEVIVYKEAVDNPFSKTVINPKEGDINYLSKDRLKFIEDNWIITSSELPKEGFIVPDTPTNVVDEGIELFHGRGKGSRVPDELHAGTYQAAVDRNAFMFGSENMYGMIYDMKVDFESQVAEELKDVILEDGKFYGDRYLQPEVYLPNGNVDVYDIRIDIYEDGSLAIVLGKDGQEIGHVFSDNDASFVIEDLEDGAKLYDHIDRDKLNDVINNRDLDKLFGEAGGFLAPDRSFKYKDGYELYKVTISPNAKIVEFTDDITMTINGKPKSIDPDIFVNYLESGKLEDIDEILLPNGKTITLSEIYKGNNKQKLNIIKKEMDVVGYRNQMEDVGSTSYYFLNQDSYTETLVDETSNKQFDEDVLKKFVENDPYRDIDAFEDASPDRVKLAKQFMGEVEDVTDGLPLLETRMKLGNQPLEWSDEVITPNKIFNPDALTRLETEIDTISPSEAQKKLAMGQGVDMNIQARFIWNDTTEFKPSEMYSRIITNTATDEDITRFFIYLATHSPTNAFARQPFSNPGSLADIVKIGIFSDIPLDEVIPMGQVYLEKQFINNLQTKNSLIGDEINQVLVNLVTEQGQFANVKEQMRNVILDAHKNIYANNPNDYFIVWRGGDLNRFYPWQSTAKRYQSAQGVMYQMVQQGYGGGRSVDSYIVHRNNMIDLDALGLSFGNEQEIIVLTEELKSPLAKRSKTLEGPSDIRNINDWWLLAREREEAFPKNGKVITNISQPLADAGQSTQQFFADVINGMDPRYKQKQPYNQLIELNNNNLYKFQDDYNALIKNGGDFNQHIFTSIPTFYEAQVVKMAALNFLINQVPLQGGEFGGPAQQYKILDIGGTEGAWAKALAKNSPLVDITVLDPNFQARGIFESGELITNAKFKQEAFSHKPEDFGKFFVEGGTTQDVQFATFDGSVKYDVVHESMALQFMGDQRADQIKFIKENVLNENGILIIEEKFTDESQTIFDANEANKNNFKSQYYTPEQLADKKLNVLLNMDANLVTVQEIQQILGENFNHVEQYWDAGNFKGFIASDIPVTETFMLGIEELDVSLTDHLYSTAPTNNEIKAAVNKQIVANGTDSKLAAQLANETVAKNPNFFNRIANALGNIDTNAGASAMKLLGRLGVAGGPALSVLGRVAPALAPGDVAIEKAIQKAVPYLDDAAARLGFGRIPFATLLPTYIAYEIGVALADVSQAALYAYDESQKKAPRQPSDFQTGLTKILLPKAYEDQAIKRSQIPGDLQAFYNTPTGKAVLEEADFGSQFMKELDQEKISRFSPGWGLTKGLISLVGNTYQASQNPSDYTTKLKDNPASIYNAGFTGR